jgi:hypothetical protein
VINERAKSFTVAPCALCSEIGLAAKALFILLLVRDEVEIKLLVNYYCN